MLQGKIGEWSPDDQAHPGRFTMFWAGRSAAAFIGNDIQGELHNNITRHGVRDDVLTQVLQGNLVIEVDDRFSQLRGEYFTVVMLPDILFKWAI